MSSVYIFGYGSILDKSSRARGDFSSSERDEKPGEQDAVLVSLLPSARLRRSWNYRCESGFTAVGLEKAPKGCEAVVCGVLFAVNARALAAFDKRERGYHRLRLNPKHLRVRSRSKALGDDGLASIEAKVHDDILCARELESRKGGGSGEGGRQEEDEGKGEGEGAIFYTYVPDCPQSADHEFPICQTYLDVILRGCLDWGGEELAREWVQTTRGWCESLSVFLLSSLQASSTTQSALFRSQSLCLPPSAPCIGSGREYCSAFLAQRRTILQKAVATPPLLPDHR